MNHQTNDNQTLKPGAQAFIPININQRLEQQSRDASPNNRSISPNHSTFNFHQQTQNWQLQQLQITGECEINNIPTTFLADTGCQQTIIHKNTIELNNNEWGYIKPFNTNVLTAEGQKANIIGIKQCKIQIGQWTGCHNILISNNLIKKCIIGMDILNICSATKHIIESFKQAVNSCTTFIRQKQLSKSQSTPNLKTDRVTTTENESHNTCLTIELEDNHINQCFTITQNSDLTIEEAQSQIIDLIKLVSVVNNITS